MSQGSRFGQHRQLPHSESGNLNRFTQNRKLLYVILSFHQPNMLGTTKTGNSSLNQRDSFILILQVSPFLSYKYQYPDSAYRDESSAVTTDHVELNNDTWQ